MSLSLINGMQPISWSISYDQEYGNVITYVDERVYTVTSAVRSVRC